MVIPYTHGLSHNLKKVAARSGVSVLFSAPRKAISMCAKVNNTRKEPKCDTRHQNPYTSCEVGVVYRFPVSCGKVYIGQTGICFNERAMEHVRCSSNASGGHLSLHCRHCKPVGCKPLLQDSTFLAKKSDQLTREVLEAVAILDNGGACISTPSVALTEKEKRFLGLFYKF